MGRGSGRGGCSYSPLGRETRTGDSESVVSEGPSDLGGSAKIGTGGVSSRAIANLDLLDADSISGEYSPSRGTEETNGTGVKGVCGGYFFIFGSLCRCRCRRLQNTNPSANAEMTTTGTATPAAITPAFVVPLANVPPPGDPPPGFPPPFGPMPRPPPLPLLLVPPVNKLVVD